MQFEGYDTRTLKSINFKNWQYLRQALIDRSYVTCKQNQRTSLETIFWKNYQNCWYFDFSVLVIFPFYYINILTALFHHLRVVIIKFNFWLRKQPPKELSMWYKVKIFHYFEYRKRHAIAMTTLTTTVNWAANSVITKIFPTALTNSMAPQIPEVWLYSNTIKQGQWQRVRKIYFIFTVKPNQSK